MVYQRGKTYLYQADDCRAEGRDEGTLVRVLFHVTLYGFCQDARCLCHLDYFREPHLVEFREDLLFRDFFRELSEKDCREKDDPVFEIEYLVEIILLHVYRMLRTLLEAFAAVDASIFVYRRQTTFNADGLRGAEAHAVRASDAGSTGNF